MFRTFFIIALALAAAAVATPFAQAVADPNGRQALDPLAVSYLQGQGYSPGEIKVLVGQGDPLAVSYLRNQGFTDEQIHAMATGETLQPATRPIDRNTGADVTMAQPTFHGPPDAIDRYQQNHPQLAPVTWLLGGSPDAIDRYLGRTDVTPVGFSSDSFAWGEFGIGAGAMLGIVLLVVGLGGALVISRQNRRRHVASA